MKWFKIISIATIIGLALAVFCSPFKKYAGFERSMIKVTTLIDAPSCQVFNYLGDSRNASKWSSFVARITPLKGKDGHPGSFRRCFKDGTEESEYWDEEVVAVEDCKRRQLTVFNLQNFPIGASGLLTEQVYETLDNGQCKLSFTLFFDEAHNTFWQQFKMHLFSYYIEGIFKKNLENIRYFNTNSESVKSLSYSSCVSTNQ